MPRKIAPKFTPGQPVTLNFSDGNTFDAVVVENIDHVCRPLTDMWAVRVVLPQGLGRQFGFTGKSISPRVAS